MRFEDRVAVVTGGGRGLGRAIAMRLAHEGAAVLLASPDEPELRETAAEITALGRQAVVTVTDITDEAAVREMALEAQNTLGGVDILINNAGIAGPTVPLGEINRSEWDTVMAINLTGAMLCAQAMVPQMIQRGGGKIINLSSIAGKIGYPLRLPYCASKWAIIGLTLTLAKELGEKNIQVNAICPGPVEGPRIDQVFQARAAETGLSIDQVRDEYLEQMALKRLVQPGDVAAMAAYLASAEADNVTGEAIDVSCGWGL